MIKVGIIGGGKNSAVGRAHAAALNLDGNWDVESGFFSRDVVTNEKSCSIWRPKRVYGSLNGFIDGEIGKLDVVIVLTPTPSHYEIISQLLEHKFNVISEKSLGTSVQQSENLKSLANTNGCKLYVTFNYTGYPMVRELRSRIISGKYGVIQSIHVEMPQETFSVIDDFGRAKPVQAWRKVDYEIPTVSLDLGVHVVHLAHFLLNDKLKRVVSVEKHFGRIETTVDTVNIIGEYCRGTLGNLWFGKSYIGYRNGLRVRGFGEIGSFDWVQCAPDYFWESDYRGHRRLIDLADPSLHIANQDRYARFKPGHPTGFIEAFSNLYEDIAHDLIGKNLASDEYVFGAESASLGLLELLCVHKSSLSNEWLSVGKKSK